MFKVIVADKIDPCLDHGLATHVFGVRFTCQDELYRLFGIAEQPGKPVRIMEEQIGPFIGGEPTGKTKGQYIGVKNGFRINGAIECRPLQGLLPEESFAQPGDQPLPVATAHGPQLFIADFHDGRFKVLQFFTPAFLAAGLGP